MNTYNRTIELRLRSLSVFAFLLVGILVWRMGIVQVVNHVGYLKDALKQQRFSKTEIASRGKILVHDSSVDPKSYYPLAFDVKRFSVVAVPNQIKDKEKVAAQLEPLVGMPQKDIFGQINNFKKYLLLKKGLTQEEADKIDSENITGITLSPEYNRYYPEGTLASQLLGFVNGDRVGNYGFEQKYNNELQGKQGNTDGEQDTKGRVISILDQEDPQDGTSYVLTIDRSVQYFVEKKLNEALTTYQADSGTVIIMDIKTGGIVAMASAPGYDPNNYSDQAKKDPNAFTNPAISNLFEPGSIFKPLIMSAAIDKGLLTPDTASTFDWHVFVQGFEIKTAERKAFGHETMTQVLQNSDNVGMVWVADKLGNDLEYKYLKDYNFFDKTGVDLSGETPGLAPQLKQWRDINRSTIAFGQGIAVTPLQIVAAYAALANGGTYIYPHVVDKIVHPDGTETQIEKREGNRVVSKQTADQLAQMLYSVVMNGTGHHAQVSGFKISAKTGTAQIPKVGGGYEDADNGLGIFIHTLAGFAPTDDPRYAMLVKLDRPKTSRYAETTAGPLFGEISSFLLNYYYRIPAGQ